MKTAAFPFGDTFVEAKLPDCTEILKLPAQPPLANPREAIRRSLYEPAGCPPLDRIVREKAEAARSHGRAPAACIVVSDNTRPVPYRGEDGLLAPILHTLFENGCEAKDILILIANGTHRPMTRQDIIDMLGPEAQSAGVRIVNHDCEDEDSLADIGVTERGTRARVNKMYLNADIKILTGLVEPHFMAGASGGRKSVCPGIFAKSGTLIFHGPELMAHPKARDLATDGNPVHEESLAVARMAGADFIVNVTLNSDFRITGVFSGELEKAHAAAVEELRVHAAIKTDKRYDLVITHGGFVARNHYQAAKAGAAAVNALKPGGRLIMAANNTDIRPVGSDAYRTCLLLMKHLGAQGFERLICSGEWRFIMDQWQVQMWGRLFAHISMEDFIYYAPQLDERDWRDIPGVNGACYIESSEQSLEAEVKAKLFIERAAADAVKRNSACADGFCAAFLADGPYCVINAPV